MQVISMMLKLMVFLVSFSVVFYTEPITYIAERNTPYYNVHKMKHRQHIPATAGCCEDAMLIDHIAAA